MFSFFKKKTKDNEIPEWASFFDNTEYSTFINELNNYFKSLNIVYKLDDGQIEVESDEFGGRFLGLINVAKGCKQDNKRNYKEIIAGHFDSLIRANNFSNEFEKNADNFEEVKQYIGVRLHENSYIAHIGKENTMGKDLGGDIYAMIVFDFPESIMNIKPEETKSWNKTADELFEIGIANIKAKYPLTITKETLGEFETWFVVAEHFFAANVILNLENRKELVGSKGSLIGLPHRHAAIIYPIENLEVVKAIYGLIPIIYGMNQEGPGSLSNSLFWYKDKKLTQLPYEIDDEKLQFTPPDSFVELLNELGE